MSLTPERRARIRRERTFFGILLLLVCIFAGGVTWYDRWLDEGNRLDTTYIPQKTPITPAILRLQEYVRIDTSHQNEIDGARWIATQLRSEQIPYEIVESAPGRANIWARIRGKQHGDGLLLASHIDVVPASPAGWTRPPFSAEIYLNQIWGRGTLDMKSITICQLEAFLALARTHQQPEHDVVFLAVADEESGSAYGMRWIVEHRRDVLDGIRYALNEGGVTETLAGRITYFGIEIGTKQLITYDLVAPTQGQLQKARISLEPYFGTGDADLVLPEVVRYLHDIAPFRLEPRDDLMDVSRTIREGNLWRLPRPYRELVQNIVWAGPVRKESDHWAMRTSLMSLPSVQPEPRIEWLRKQVEPFGVSMGPKLFDDPVARLSSDRTMLYELIRGVVRKRYNVSVGSQVLAKSGNDSRFLRPLGIECYGMWPFPVDFYQTEGIHAVDERVRADWFQSGVDVTKEIVKTYSVSTQPAG